VSNSNLDIWVEGGEQPIKIRCRGEHNVWCDLTVEQAIDVATELLDNVRILKNGRIATQGEARLSVRIVPGEPIVPAYRPPPLPMPKQKRLRRTKPKSRGPQESD
jgi:hypothetical protein